MVQIKRSFATAINCMDGRVQEPVIDWIRRLYAVDYVDMITAPGPEHTIAEGKDQALLDTIKRCIEISVTRHNSRLIVVVGHHDCAGNPAGKETQFDQIRTAARTLETWNFGVEVIGLWVDENREVHLVPGEPGKP